MGGGKRWGSCVTPAYTDWQSKSDAQRAEQERLAAGPDPGKAGGTQDRTLMEILVSLAQSVHRARTQGHPPEPDTALALAQLAAALLAVLG